MDVLITGSTGYFGKYFIKRLKEKPFVIYESNSKIANLFNIDNLFIYNKIKFDYIFHLAARTKAADWCLHHLGEQWIENQIINTNIINYWKSYQPQAKFICIGTSCSYAPSDQLQNEDLYLKGEPDVGLRTYAMTKRMMLEGCMAVAKQYNLQYIHFIFNTLYGPYFQATDNHFIYDLIRKVVNAKESNIEIVLWGDGSQKRELIYIDDAVNIIFNLLNCKNISLNVCCGQDYTIREYVNKISKIIQYENPKIAYDNSKYIGTRRKVLSPKKILSLLPKDFKFTDIDVGLTRTIKYFLDSCDNNPVPI